MLNSSNASHNLVVRVWDSGLDPLPRDAIAISASLTYLSRDSLTSLWYNTNMSTRQKSKSLFATKEKP
jgi:hypothetical protein